MYKKVSVGSKSAASSISVSNSTPVVTMFSTMNTAIIMDRIVITIVTEP
jgi:hypothetical protein